MQAPTVEFSLGQGKYFLQPGSGYIHWGGEGSGGAAWCLEPSQARSIARQISLASFNFRGRHKQSGEYILALGAVFIVVAIYWPC